MLIWHFDEVPLHVAALDSFTRLSISMTPPSSRKHRPPDVAPKPIRNSSPSPSHEDVQVCTQHDIQHVHTAFIPNGAHQQQQQYEGDEDVHSEYDYDEIDPLEKEWMLASAQADIDGLQRLMMTDSSLLNRKGFLHGYTALHWAAKHGRMDILSMLLLQGATTNIKSVSPLLARAAGTAVCGWGSAGVVVKWLLGDEYVPDHYLTLVLFPFFT